MMQFRIVDMHVRYCCSVWGYDCITIMRRLQKLSNRSARVVTNTPFEQVLQKLQTSLNTKNSIRIMLSLIKHNWNHVRNEEYRTYHNTVLYQAAQLREALVCSFAPF